MIDGLFNQPNYLATKKMLDATALRHEAIASNIANVETPGYKRIDVGSSFADELKSAVASRDINKMASLTPSIIEDTTAIPNSLDGNTVQLETELMNLNQNTMAHTLETQLVSGTLLRLRMAISGQVS